MFEDERVPLEVRLEAWNPYIPLEPEWSGFPAALFDWTLTNPLDRAVEVSIAFSMQNPIKSRDDEGGLGFGGNVNARLDDAGLAGVRFTSRRNAPDTPESGDVAVATVTCGPGVTQLMTALPAAVRARLPIVVFAGEAPLRSGWYNQGIDQAPMVAASSSPFRLPGTCR